MEVILRKNVESLGGINEIVRVKDGFARNYLFPEGLAIPATPGNVKNLSGKIEAAKAARSKRVDEAKALASKFQNVNLRVVAKSGKEGKLFGSVTAGDIAELLQQKTSLEVDKKRIVLPQAIKRTGAYTILIKLEIGVSATVHLDVVPEEGFEGEGGAEGAAGQGAEGEGTAEEQLAAAEAEQQQSQGSEGSADPGGGGKKKRKKHVNEAELELPE